MREFFISVIVLLVLLLEVSLLENLNQLKKVVNNQTSFIIKLSEEK